MSAKSIVIIAVISLVIITMGVILFIGSYSAIASKTASELDSADLAYPGAITDTPTECICTPTDTQPAKVTDTPTEPVKPSDTPTEPYPPPVTPTDPIVTPSVIYPTYPFPTHPVPPRPHPGGPGNLPYLVLFGIGFLFLAIVVMLVFRRQPSSSHDDRN